METNELGLMYYLYMYTVDTGQQVVTRTSTGSFLDCSTVTAGKRLCELADIEFVEVRKFQIMRGHGYRYEYHITANGVAFVKKNMKKCSDAFYEKINALYTSGIERARKISGHVRQVKAVSPKQRRLL